MCKQNPSQILIRRQAKIQTRINFLFGMYINFLTKKTVEENNMLFDEHNRKVEIGLSVSSPSESNLFLHLCAASMLSA